MGLAVEIEAEIIEQFEVWQENVGTLNVFLMCQKDWKHNSKGLPVSIEKTALKAIMDMMEVENMKDTLADIIQMQDAVVEVFNGI